MFDYRPGNSPVHLLNPVTKLAVAVGLTVVVFLLPNPWGPALIAVALLGVAAVAGFPGRVAKLAAILTLPFLVAVVLVQDEDLRLDREDRSQRQPLRLSP